MALKSDDSDLRESYLQTHFGGNGDYYITIIQRNDEGLLERSSVRIAISGGYTPKESKIRNLVAQLHWEMEEFKLNEHPE